MGKFILGRSGKAFTKMSPFLQKLKFAFFAKKRGSFIPTQNHLYF